jgi:hypothetical protein
VFYVKLKKNIDKDEQGMALEGRVDFLYTQFAKEKDYPVLEVQYQAGNKEKRTFYHMPNDNGELGWFASDYFLFSRTVH